MSNGIFNESVTHFLDGLMAGGSTNMVDDDPKGMCCVQDSLDNQLFEGTLRQCLNFHGNQCDWGEKHYLFDENEDCWLMTPHGLVKE
jgi:hypothetical protein